MRDFCQPPRFHRCFLAVVAALVPPWKRTQWLSCNVSVLTSLWVLIQRGEFPRAGKILLASFCRECLRSAVFTRFTPQQIVVAAGHPLLPIAMLAALLLGTGFISGGLPTLVRLWSEFGTASDFVFGHVFVLTLAGMLALHAVFTHRGTVHGWVPAVYLCAKTMVAMITLTCIWMEAASALQGVLRHSEGLWVASRVASTIVFLFACGWLAAWCMCDQRQRCPSCLRRVGLPVSLGSWASVLGPASTVLVCPQGHGWLVVPETQFSPGEEWARMEEPVGRR